MEMNKELTGNQLPTLFSLNDFSKKNFRNLLFLSKWECMHIYPYIPFGIHYGVFYHAPPVQSLNFFEERWLKERNSESFLKQQMPVWTSSLSGEENSFMHLWITFRSKFQWSDKKLYWKPPSNALNSYQWRAQGSIMERGIGSRVISCLMCLCYCYVVLTFVIPHICLLIH